jgi:hypothetical protein
VQRRAAGDDVDAVDRRDLLRRHVELGKADLPALVQPSAKRLADRLRLLVDLLEHEVLVPALLGGVEVPLDVHHLGLAHDEPGGVMHDHAGRGHDRDLAVVQHEHLARVLEDGRDVARDDRLALSDADDERRVLPCRDDRLRVVEMHDREGIRALEVLDRSGDSRGQITGEVALDEVRDCLGVGLGAQDVPVGREVLAQLDVVLDDAVVHDRDLAGAVDVRVGVLLARLAVRRPPGVPNAHAASDRSGVERLLEVDQLSDTARDGELPGVDDGDARRVIAAVLEPCKPAEQHVSRAAGADVSDDSTHR